MTARLWTGRIGALAVMGALFAGCGLFAGPDEPAPAEAPTGATHQDCWYAEDPGRALSLADVGRAGLRGNIGLWGRAMAATDTIELSVRYADDGELQWVQAIRSTVPEERTLALENLLFNGLDEGHERDWGVRVLVVDGDVVDVTPSIICDPEVRLPGLIPSGIGNDPRAMRAYQQIRGRRIPVRVSLDRNGRVTNARLVRSTHSQYIDEYIINYIWNSSFKAKLHDGIGVATTFEVDLYFPRRP